MYFQLSKERQCVGLLYRLVMLLHFENISGVI
jgi:hypothetical protein